MIINATEAAHLVRTNWVALHPEATEPEIQEQIKYHLGDVLYNQVQTPGSALKTKPRSTTTNFRAYQGSSTLIFITLSLGLMGLCGVAVLAFILRSVF